MKLINTDTHSLGASKPLSCVLTQLVDGRILFMRNLVVPKLHNASLLLLSVPMYMWILFDICWA